MSDGPRSSSVDSQSIRRESRSQYPSQNSGPGSGRSRLSMSRRVAARAACSEAQAGQERRWSSNRSFSAASSSP